MNEALAYWGENLNEKTIKMMRSNDRKWIGDSVSSNAVPFIGLDAFDFVWNRETISSNSQKWNNDQLSSGIRGIDVNENRSTVGSNEMLKRWNQINNENYTIFINQ